MVTFTPAVILHHRVQRQGRQHHRPMGASSMVQRIAGAMTQSAPSTALWRPTRPWWPFRGPWLRRCNWSKRLRSPSVHHKSLYDDYQNGGTLFLRILPRHAQLLPIRITKQEQKKKLPNMPIGRIAATCCCASTPGRVVRCSCPTPAPTRYRHSASDSWVRSRRPKIYMAPRRNLLPGPVGTVTILDFIGVWPKLVRSKDRIVGLGWHQRIRCRLRGTIQRATNYMHTLLLLVFGSLTCVNVISAIKDTTSRGTRFLNLALGQTVIGLLKFTGGQMTTK